MSVKPKTIDDLGPEVSIRYIESQKGLGETFDPIGHLPEVLSQSSYFPEWAEFQDQFETSAKNFPWADFLPPPGFFQSIQRLFRHQIIPSMGTQERLEKTLENLQKRKKKKIAKGAKKLPQSEIEDQDSEKQRHKLETLLELILQLNKDLNLINGLKNQYHKG